MKFITLQHDQSLSVGPYGRRGIQKYCKKKKGVVQNSHGRIIILSDCSDTSKSETKDKYNDKTMKLSYTGEKHNKLQRGNKLFNNIVEQYKQTGKIHHITVFVKLQANNWERLGVFVLTNTLIINSTYKFDLQRIDFIPRRVSDRTQKIEKVHRLIKELI